MTAWVENGQTQVLPDIYKYDDAASFNGIDWAVVKKLSLKKLFTLELFKEKIVSRVKNE